MKNLIITSLLISVSGLVLAQDSLNDELQEFINVITNDCYNYYQVFSVEEGLQHVDSTRSLSICSRVDTTLGPYIISEEICKLSNLIEISFECDNRVIIPNEIECLSNLRAIWTGSSSLIDSDIPISIKNCLNLEFISFGGSNQLTHIPNGIYNLPKLKFFDINLNFISTEQMLLDLYRLTEIKSLKYVYLNNFNYPESEKQKLIKHLQDNGIEIGFSL